MGIVNFTYMIYYNMYNLYMRWSPVTAAVQTARKMRRPGSDSDFRRRSVRSVVMQNIFERLELKLRPEANLSVCESGFEECEPGAFHGPGYRECFIIHFIWNGKGIYEVGGKHYDIGPNQGFLIRPNETIYYGPDLKEPWTYFWVGFNGLDAERLLRLSGLSNNYVFTYTKDDILKETLVNLHHASQKVASREYAMIGYLYLFFSCLINDAFAVKDKAVNNHITKIMDYIEQNYDKDISIRTIGEHYGISRSQLYKIFQETLSISPMDYLVEFRLRKACALLRATDLSVNDVCLSAGFRDGKHFSKIFKERLGLTPSEYRRQNRRPLPNGI